MRPQTTYEQYGLYTELEDEIEFLKLVESETDIELLSVGMTTRGREIRGVRIGNPQGSTIMYVANQHPTEWCAREAALIWIAKLAYREDPLFEDYLDNFQVIVVPNANPDGSVSPRSRFNGDGYNVNNFWYTLLQPENRAITSLITEYNPVIIQDLHEWDANRTETIAYSGSTNPQLHPDMQAHFQPLLDSAITVLEAAGYNTTTYSAGANPVGGTPIQVLQTTGYSNHSITVLTESLMRRPHRNRVQANLMWMLEFLKYHSLNHVSLDLAQQASIDSAVLGESPVYIASRGIETPTSPLFPEVEPLSSYSIPENIDIPYELLDLLGIELSEEERTISPLQKARNFISLLFDPRSQYYIGSGWRPNPSKPPEDLPVSSGFSDLWVKVGGRRVKVTEAWVKVGGRRVKVTEAVAKTGGRRYSMLKS